MVLDRHTVLTLTILGIAILNNTAQIGECPPSPRFRYYLHLAHTRTATNPSMDQVAESIDYSFYDMLLLGGDMALSSSLDDMTMEHLDSILDLGNDHTLWALGNHDYADLDRIQAFTHRPPYYAYYSDKITFLVLDTQDSLSNIVGQQRELFDSVTDTLQATTHLVLLHHKLIWMYGNEHLQPYINTIPNGGLGDCFYCINPNNFYSELYPVLLEAEAKGIEVICIAGDIGFHSNEFEYTTPEGVQFLASGINAGHINNQALVFKHDVVNDTLFWEFTSMSDLLVPMDTTAPDLYNITFSPEEVTRGELIRILLEAGDQSSGIDEIKMDIVNQLGQQLQAIDTKVTDWISLGENMYAYDLVIADSAMYGDWSVSALNITDSAGNVLCLCSSDSILATFTVTGPNGTNEQERDEILLYPNPSSGIIYILSGQSINTIDIYNSEGVYINIIQSNEFNFIDLTQELPGLYLVRFLYSDNSYIIKRVLIY